MSNIFTIETLGAQGDGVAQGGQGQLFIPFTLPGETVNAAPHGKRADLVAVLQPSAERVVPPCRHFGRCGGCALQHWQEPSYRQWKRRKLADALRAVGLEAELEPLVPCAPGTRRRITLAARRTEAGILLGYHEAFSHTIVAIEECPITLPQIVARLDDIRALAGAIAATGDIFRLAVTQTDSGLDIAVSGGGRLDETRRLAASRLAVAKRFARVSLDGEILVEPAKPLVTFGDVAVELPPGGFLQATQGSEEAMAALVEGHLARAKRTLDLFSGAGTFALRLAHRSEVHAVEADDASLAALERGFRFGARLKTVTVERRDLFRRPLTFKELNRFDGLVFDPPRAGAEDQARQIARSEVPFVAAVSCNPVTLARDLSLLVAGGYRLKSVTPIDQFLWSPHVEAVALLEKLRRRR